MILHTLVRDCLFLNWALPRRMLPQLPEPLRYEVHSDGGESVVFVSALLFRQDGLRAEAVPALRFSYPQFNLRLCVLDGEDVPAVFFQRILVPGWVVPGARLVGRQPAQVGKLDYPNPSRDLDAESWSWVVRRRGVFEVTARQAAPTPGARPSLGSWETTVNHIRRRPRGYALMGEELRRVETAHPRVAVWPVQAAIGAVGLLCASFALEEPAQWPDLHSAWLCPEIPMTFELAGARQPALGERVPAAG